MRIDSVSTGNPATTGSAPKAQGRHTLFNTAQFSHPPAQQSCNRTSCCAAATGGQNEHFLINFGQHADLGDHAGQESGREGAAAEAKEVDAVAGLVVAHDELVAFQDVVVEACPLVRSAGATPFWDRKGQGGEGATYQKPGQ